jgi:hypothetical protein
MFHLFKQSRVYTGQCYCGPTNGFRRAEYKTLKLAKEQRDAFQQRNPVGWDIYDAKTKKLVI